MEVQRRVSSWCVPLAISFWAISSISSCDRAGAASSGGGGAGCLRFRFDFVFEVEAGLPKPREAGGALRRLVSTEVRPRSEMMLMLLMISSRRDYGGG